MKKRSRKATSDRLPKRKSDNLLSKQNDVDIVTDCDIFKSQIDKAKNDFINDLPEKDMIYNSSCFNAMLRYIYTMVFRNSDSTSYLPCKISYDEPGFYILDSLFDYYVFSLCGMCMITPTITGYCIMTGLSNETVSRWYHDLNDKNYKYQYISKWYQLCEQFLVSKTIENNSIGSMFLLKAKYNYNDQPKQEINITHSSPQFTLEQLQAKHDLSIDSGVEKND